MGKTENYFKIWILCLSTVIFTFQVSGTYAKYHTEQKEDIPVSIFHEKDGTVFLPYSYADKITYTIPKDGYYLFQLYGSAKREPFIGYVQLKKSMILNIKYEGKNIPNIYEAGIHLNKELENKADLTDYVYPVSQAPKFLSVPSYFILTYIGNLPSEEKPVILDKKKPEPASNNEHDKTEPASEDNRSDSEPAPPDNNNENIEDEIETHVDSDHKPDKGPENEQNPETDIDLS